MALSSFRAKVISFVILFFPLFSKAQQIVCQISDPVIDSNNIISTTIITNQNPVDIQFEMYQVNKWVNRGSLNQYLSLQSGGVDTLLISQPLSLHIGKNQVRITSYACEYTKTIDYQNQNFDFPQGPWADVNHITFKSKVLYEVYDQQGEVVLKGTSTSVSLNALEAGVYYIYNDQDAEVFSIKKE